VWRELHRSAQLNDALRLPAIVFDIAWSTP